MKVGKVSQTVLKRSLLKPLQFHREESMFPPSVEEMCYGIKAGEGEEVLSSTAVLYGNEKDLGVFEVSKTILQWDIRFRQRFTPRILKKIIRE